MAAMAGRLLERLFQIKARGSTVSDEVLGGVTHFMGSVFNLMATASVLTVGGLPFVDGVVAGAWASFAGQLLVGIWSNLPISVNAGAGPNLTVAYLLAQSVGQGGLGSYQAAMTCCMVSGLVIALLTAIGAISVLTNCVPISMKLSICVGIGLLCAFVGFQQVRMVVRSDNGLIGPGDFAHDREIWFSLGGLLFLTLLNDRKVKGAILITMFLMAILHFSFVSGWPPMELDALRLPPLYLPDMAVMSSPNFWMQVAAMVMVLVFDAMGCIFGFAKLAGRMDMMTGEVEGGNGMFYGIGLGTTISALCGASPSVVSGASAAAIMDGARTGLSTCVSGCLFLLIGIPIATTLAALPPCTSSFVLIYVGVSMSADAAHIKWDDPIAAVPAFLCLISQPFLFSIADGVFLGLASSFLLSLFSGRMFCSRSQVEPETQLELRLSPNSMVSSQSGHPQRLSRSSSVQFPSDGYSRRNSLQYQGVDIRRESSLGDMPLLHTSDSMGSGLYKC